jgi:hypothetical protein
MGARSRFEPGRAGAKVVAFIASSIEFVKEIELHASRPVIYYNIG